MAASHSEIGPTGRWGQWNKTRVFITFLLGGLVFNVIAYWLLAVGSALAYSDNLSRTIYELVGIPAALTFLVTLTFFILELLPQLIAAVIAIVSLLIFKRVSLPFVVITVPLLGLLEEFMIRSSILAGDSALQTKIITLRGYLMFCGLQFAVSLFCWWLTRNVRLTKEGRPQGVTA
jgi:hypothetical protein